MTTRTESDFLGTMQVPAHALYGIHSMRAKENFLYHKPFHIEWYKAVGLVKMAAYQTYRNYKSGVMEKFGSLPSQFRWIDDSHLHALEASALGVSGGEMFEHFIVSAHQGGAGTSINMNINEIVANMALQKLGLNAGNYSVIDPINDANIFQSTNDVIPTALRVATMLLLKNLEQSINSHRQLIEQHENGYRNVIRQGYTQMQAAVPSSYDKLLSGYNNALSRDWWRVSKCLERIKEVNLGGGAIGTGLSIPRFYIMTVVQQLQQITNLPISRSENMSDTTSNLDSFVEVHAMLKAHAVNLEKMVSDLRLLASDIFVNREVQLPQKQVGSSIMPTKVNPVIVEYVVSCAQHVYANDEIVTRLASMGCLDLNAYLPAIGDALLDTIKLLISMNNTLERNLWTDFKINSLDSSTTLFHNPTITTALVGKIGYNASAQLGKLMVSQHISVLEANRILNFLPQDDLLALLEPSNLLEMGFVLG